MKNRNEHMVEYYHTQNAKKALRGLEELSYNEFLRFVELLPLAMLRNINNIKEGNYSI